VRVLDLTAKDLLQLLRDGRTAGFLLIMPIAFTFLFGFAFGGFGGESDPRLPVGLLDLDDSAMSGRHLLALLDASQVVRPVELKAAQQQTLDKKVRDGDLAAAVIVPAGHSQALLAGTSLPLTVVVDPGSTGGLTAQTEIQAAAGRLAASAESARLAAQLLDQQATLNPEQVAGWSGPADRQGFLETSLEQALELWDHPSIAVRLVRSGAIAIGEESSAQGGFLHTSPSMMVQFAIGGLIGAATMLFSERKSRALRRLLTTPITRAQILLGHYLAMVVLILIQLTVLVIFGQLALRVPYTREPLAILLVMIGTALWTAAFGLLIGALARSEEQVVLFSLIPMFVLSGLGGAWVPLEYTGRTFQSIGHLLPTAWAMDGFENIVIRGLGLGSVLFPAAAMLGYAFLLFALAAWRFRTE